MTITSAQQDAFIRRLAAAASYFCCLIAFYIDIGQDMGAKYFMPILLPVIAALVLTQYATRVSIFSRAALPNLITSLGWSMTFPLLYAWTYNSVWYQSKICFDFVVGTAAFVLLMSIESVLTRLGHVKISSLFMALLNFACLAIPFIQWVYYCLFWHCLTPASLMALYLTNYNESIDFIQSNLGLVPTLLIFAGFALFIYLAYRAHLHFARLTEDDEASALRLSTLGVLTFLALWAHSYYIPQTSFAELWEDVTTYVTQTQEYSIGHDERYDSLIIDTENTLAAKAPGTVILIFNLIIFTVASLLFGVDRALLSLLTYYIASRIIDKVEEGLDTAKQVIVITDDAEPIADAIYKRLGRTVTISSARGLVSGKKEMLYVVITRLELPELREIVEESDESAFITISDVNEIIGKHVQKVDKAVVEELEA